MAGRSPTEIWDESLDEGERRLARTPLALGATGFAGGAEVMIGVVATVVASAAFTTSLGVQGAHIVGSLFFGIAFVLITIGRAELFTENFLIPVGAVQARRSTVALLVRMWAITLALNLVGVAAFAAIFAVHGVLEPSALRTAGTLADTYGLRASFPAFMSAIAAGGVMTLFTWMTAAASSDSTRVLLALLVGFLLSAPSLNHAVVSFGEIGFGLIAGTTAADAGDLFRNFGLAIAGNFVGGIGLVYLTRVAQVMGEPS